jgi:hypothetical protein
MYVIFDVPAETPVTTPPEVMVATAGVALVQGVEASGVPEPVKVVVAPTQALNVPDIVGVPFTVTVCVTEHPSLVR